VFTTLARVFDSSVGRKHLHVEPDPDHGLRGTTTKSEFVKGFTKLVTDVALGKQSSRSLNTNEDIDAYFRALPASEHVATKRGRFVPSDIIAGKSVASPPTPVPTPTPTRSKQRSLTVLPGDLKIRHGSPRLLDIARELKRLKRKQFPNAGAVLLRVFLELSIVEYLKRTGEMDQIVNRLQKKGSLKYDLPTMKQLQPEIVRIAKARLPVTEARTVEKALRHDRAAPFTLEDLHAFVHQSQDLPGERDIEQFWLRTQPLFRLMLERDP
jgi:hypothetical protein